MQTKQFRGWAGSTLACVAAFSVHARTAHAEADTFGLGDGHHGAKVVAGNENINTYAALAVDAAPGATVLTLGTPIDNEATSPTPFAAGDLVLVWRATGVAPSEAPSGANGRINLSGALATTSDPAVTEPGLVGRYEFARVQSVAGTALTLTAPLVRGFTKNVSQVIRVPEYTTVTVPSGAAMRATAWQQVGATPAHAGGMLIFLATGAVTNSGTIHANGRGFHGGLPANHGVLIGLGCADANGTAEDGYAPKGESIVDTAYGNAYGGNGNIANGGGGGDCLQGGGGGGANLGAGGVGGATALQLGTGGLGGAGIDYSLFERLSLGGGGGAGQNSSGPASFGGFGGGVVYIRAAALVGQGRISANGATAAESGILGLPPIVAGDGGGGGGAGGTMVLRFTGDADCDALLGAAGDGSDATAAGLPVFGAGGGGGAGRILFQRAAATQTCNVDTTPGDGGNGGGGGSTGGQTGPANPDPDPGPFCTSDANCPAASPFCDVAAGTCSGCSGPFGGGSPQACSVATSPVCLAAGTCAACAGDFGGGSVAACQLSGQPYCTTTGASAGACGRCETDADCTTGPGHTGSLCHVPSGSCGTACTVDSDCALTQWCSTQAVAGGVCVAKTPNGEHVPQQPPIDGECTTENGARTCLSLVCEESDDLCGKKNDSACGEAGECRSSVCFGADQKCGKPNSEPCTNVAECRSAVCFETDDKCGRPNGEACGAAGECRSALCEAGRCVQCSSDDQCPAGNLCDTSGNCQLRVDGGASSGGTGGSSGTGANGASSDGGDLGIGGLSGGSCASAPGDSGTGIGGLLAALGLLFTRARTRARSHRG